MLPYIFAAVGGYLVGDSMKGKQYAEGGSMEEGGVGEEYESMTKHQIEKEYKKLNEKRDLLKKKYGTFNSDEVVENEKKIDKIITLLYGKDFSGVGQKFKYSEGGMTKTEPELPHRYKIGDVVSFMKSDYSSDSGKIVGKRISYINMKGYNIYDVELKNGKFTVIAESDILDDYSKNRKFYNPD